MTVSNEVLQAVNSLFLWNLIHKLLFGKNKGITLVV
jgi:hypothetical protein